MLTFSGSGTFIILQQSYTPSILHLILTRYNSLIANTLLSVRYYQRHLHTTYTQPIQPTRNLHAPHAATWHRHGRAILRHRGIEKSVAPTNFSTSLWRKAHFIRPNRLCGSGMWCVRCMQGVCKMLWIHLTLMKPLYINLLRAKSVRWQ